MEIKLTRIILQADKRHHIVNAKPDYSKFVRPGKPEPLEPAPELADFIKKARQAATATEEDSGPAQHNNPPSLTDIIKD